MILGLYLINLNRYYQAQTQRSCIIACLQKRLTSGALTIFLVVALSTGLGIGLWKKKSESLSTPPATVRYALLITM